MKELCETRRVDITVQRPAAEEVKPHGRHCKAPLLPGLGEKAAQEKAKVQDRGYHQQCQMRKRRK